LKGGRETPGYPGDRELRGLCREMGLTVRQAIRASRGWNPDKYYRRRKELGRVPLDFACALADLSTILPDGPRLSREGVLRRLKLI